MQFTIQIHRIRWHCISALVFSKNCVYLANIRKCEAKPRCRISKILTKNSLLLLPSAIWHKSDDAVTCVVGEHGMNTKNQLNTNTTDDILYALTQHIQCKHPEPGKHWLSMIIISNSTFSVFVSLKIYAPMKNYPQILGS